MVKILTTITSFLFMTSTVVFAKNLSIDCSTPAQFQGRSAILKGSLSLTPQVSGSYMASGLIKGQLIEPRAKAIVFEKKAVGQYDDLTSQGRDKYFHGGVIMSNQNDILEVYINLTRKDLSFVSYNNLTYKMECK